MKNILVILILIAGMQSNLAYALTIINATGCIYSNSSNTSIDCTLTTDNGTIPYTATGNDPMPYGQQLWAALNAGAYGAIGAYTPPTLSAQQKAYNALATGIVITSTGTAVLNGTYPTDQNAQNKVNGLTTFVLLNGTFPGGGTTMPWFDTSGTAHTFPSIAAFKNFATAFATYVSTVLLYSDSNGQAVSLPSNAITIP